MTSNYSRALAGVLALVVSLSGLVVQAQQQSFILETQKFRQELGGATPEEIADAVEARIAKPDCAELDALFAAEVVSYFPSANLGWDRFDKTLTAIEKRFPDSWSVQCGVAQAYSRRATALSQVGVPESSQGEASAARARAIQEVAAARKLAADASEPNAALPEFAPFRSPNDATRLFLTILLPSTTNTAAKDYARLQALTPLDEKATIAPNLYRFDTVDFLAPKDKAGEPLFFATPQSFESAKSDGERYMALAAEYLKASSPEAQPKYRYEWAMIVDRLFGTSRHANIERNRRDAAATSVVEMMKTLGDDETVLQMRGEMGAPDEFVKVKLPEAYNYFAIWKELFDADLWSETSDALLAARFDPREANFQTPLWSQLSSEYQRRGRNDLALATLRKRLDDCEEIQKYQALDVMSFHAVRSIATDDAHRIKELLPTFATPAAKISGYEQDSYPGALEISSQYVSKLCFKAYRLNANYVLDQMKDPAFLAKYFKRPTPSFGDMLSACAYEDFERTGRVSHVGTPDTYKYWTLKPENDRKTIVDVAAEWSVEIQPDSRGQFKTTRVEIPQLAPGNYYIVVETPSVDAPNRLIMLSTATLQLPRTLIVRKLFDDGFRYFFLDSKTGEPRVGIDAEFYSITRQNPNERQPAFKADAIQGTTDASGAVLLPFKNNDGTRAQYGSVLAVAREDSASTLDFANLVKPWEVDSMDELQGGYCGNVTIKPTDRFERFLPTILFDRAVACGGDSVNFIFRADRASYETALDAVSPYANAELSLQITVYNPFEKNPVLFYKDKIKLDGDGTYADSFAIPKDVLAGLCYFTAKLDGKPIFITAPAGDLRVLGRETYADATRIVLTCPKTTPGRDESFAIDVDATANDGSPVKNAPFEYEIVARSATPQAYPSQPLDWFYGKGYGAFNPGAAEILGAAAPEPLGNGAVTPSVSRSLEPIRGEATSDAFGKFKIFVAPSKDFEKLVGDIVYTVSVQRKLDRPVALGQRRIVTTKVRAGQAPLRVEAIRDKGFYRADEAPVVRVSAESASPRVRPSKADLTLAKVERDANGAPVFSDVETQSVELVDGRGDATLPPLAPGQYRLSVAARTSVGEGDESASLFVVRGDAAPDAPLFANALELVPNKAEYAPGETATIQILSSNPNAVVAICDRSFCGELSGEVRYVRLENGVGYVDVPISPKDVPNTFVAASTVSEGAYASQLVELVVPPLERFVELKTTLETAPDSRKVKARTQVLNGKGEPVQARVCVSVYDSRLDPRADDAVPTDFRKEYWKWSRFSETLDRANSPALATPIPLTLPGNVARFRREYEAIYASTFGRTRGEEDRYATSAGRESQKTRALDPAARLQPIFWSSNLKTDASGVVEFEFETPKDVPSARVKIVAFGKGETVGSDLSEVAIK